MAIAYASSGTSVATATSGAALNPTCSATVDAGDILIAHVAYRTNLTDSPSTPADWTLLYGPITVTTTTAEGRHWIYGKVAAGDEDGDAISFGSPSVTYLRMGIIRRYTGRVSGTLADCVPTASFSNVNNETDPAAPTVTTTVTDARAVYCYYQTDDNAAVSLTGATGGTWLARDSVSSSLGDDGTIANGDCIPTGNPGTITGGGGSTANDQVNTIGFEIRPNAPSISHTENRSGQIDITGAIRETYAPAVSHTDRVTGVVAVSGTRRETYDTPSGIVARTWDGSNDYLRTAIGGVDHTGALTIAMLVRVNETGDSEPLDLHYTSANALRINFGVYADVVSLSTGGTGATSTTTVPVGEWVLVAATRAAGPAVTPTMHIYDGSWHHEAGSTTTADPTAAGGGATVRFGALSTVVFALVDIAVAAEWTSELSDANIEALLSGDTTQDWIDLSPQALWQFNQADVADDVLDLTGNGADETVRNETTVGSDGPDGWTYITVTTNTDRVSGVITVSGTMWSQVQNVDLPTGAILLSGSVSESWSITNVETPAGTISVSGTLGESFTPGGETFTDNRSGQIDVTGTRRESLSFSERTTGLITITGIVSESWTVETIYTDRRSGQIDVSGTTRESSSQTTLRTGTIVVSGAMDDQYAGATTDLVTGTISVTGARREWGWVSDTSTTYPQVVLGDSPDLYWRLGDPVGSPMAVDVSGNGRHGAVIATVYDPPTFGVADALVNDADTATTWLGGDDYVTSDTRIESSWDPFTVGGSFTVEGWYSREAAYNSDMTFWSTWLQPWENFVYLNISGVDSRMYFFAGEGVPVWWTTAESDWPGQDQWVHVVLTFDDTTNVAELFINGASKGTKNVTGTTITQPHGTFSLSDPSLTTDLWFGEIDEVAVWTSILTPAQIKEHYEVGSGIRQEAPSGTVVISGAVSEQYLLPTIDSASGTVTISGTVSESWALGYTDRVAGTLTLSGTRRESNSRTVERTGTILVSGTIRESYVGATTDRVSGTIVVSGTRFESNSRATRESGTIILSGTVSESWTVSGGTQTHSVSGTITLSGTRRESQSRSVRGTGTILISGTVSESYGVINTDRATGTITLSGASRESSSQTARSVGTITISGTLSDEYVGATVDRRSGTITLSGTQSDQYATTKIDLRSGIIALTGTRRESWFWTATDKRTGTITIDGSPGEIYIPSGVTTDKPTGTIVLSGSVRDIHSRWDWVDGERWPHDSDARWGNDVGERWEVDPVA